MKRKTSTVRLKFLAIVFAAFIAILAIIITLICVFTIKPETKSTVADPESTVNSELIVNSGTTTVESTVESSMPPSSAPDAPPPSTDHFIPESAEVDDSYFSNTLFIGNSITEGFKAFSGLDTATFYEGRGMTVESIHKMKVIREDGSTDTDGHGDKTIMDALHERQFDQIYILLGANELGWVYPDVFINQYSKLIDDIRALQPNAKICVQSILPVSAKRSETDDVYNNAKIDNLNKMIIQMSAEKGIPYLNAAEAFKDENGALPEDQTSDGINLEGNACRKWRDYVKTHTMQ